MWIWMWQQDNWVWRLSDKFKLPTDSLFNWLCAGLSAYTLSQTFILGSHFRDVSSFAYWIELLALYYQGFCAEFKSLRLIQLFVLSSSFYAEFKFSRWIQVFGLSSSFRAQFRFSESTQVIVLILGAVFKLKFQWSWWIHVFGLNSTFCIELKCLDKTACSSVG